MRCLLSGRGFSSISETFRGENERRRRVELVVDGVVEDVRGQEARKPLREARGRDQERDSLNPPSRVT